MCVCMCIYIYIYTYIERERERERYIWLIEREFRDVVFENVGFGNDRLLGGFKHR